VTPETRSGFFGNHPACAHAHSLSVMNVLNPFTGDYL
jgi:hypothetical protein